MLSINPTLQSMPSAPGLPRQPAAANYQGATPSISAPFDYQKAMMMKRGGGIFGNPAQSNAAPTNISPADVSPPSNPTGYLSQGQTMMDNGGMSPATMPQYPAQMTPQQPQQMAAIAKMLGGLY